MMHPPFPHPTTKNLPRPVVIAALAELTLGPRHAPRPRWQLRARCLNNTLFYETDGTPNARQQSLQRAICAACPVAGDCLADALATENSKDNRAGMRGGLTETERGILADPDPAREEPTPRPAARAPGRSAEQLRFVQKVQALAEAGATVPAAMAATGYRKLNPFSRRLWRADRTDLLRALRHNETTRAA